MRVLLSRPGSSVVVAALLGVCAIVLAWRATGTGLTTGLMVPVAGLLAASGLGQFRKRPGWKGEGGFLAPVIFLACLGQAFLMTIGHALAEKGRLSDPGAFSTRQAYAAFLGFILMGAIARWAGPRLVRRLTSLPWTLVAGSAVLVVLTALFGVEINGRRLWLDLGPITVQPVEVVKVAIVLMLAGIFSDRLPFLTWKRSSLLTPDMPRWRHTGPLLLALAVALLPLFFQGDLGPTLLLVTVTVVMFLAAGGPWLHLLTGALAVAAGASIAYFLGFPSIVRTRVDMWLEPFGRAEAVARSLWAAAAGRVTGSGIGLGNPADIPVAASDFSYSAILEETGFLGGAAVLLCYAVIVVLGIRTARRNTTPALRLAATGLTSLLVLQALLIAAGNLAIFPLTGITLPLVSLGGSSLIVQLATIGLIMAISRKPRTGEEPDSPDFAAPAGRLRLLQAGLLVLLLLIAAAAFHRTVWAAGRIEHTPYHDLAFLERVRSLVDAGELVASGDRVRFTGTGGESLSVRQRRRVEEILPYLEPIPGDIAVPADVARITNPRLVRGMIGPELGRILDRRGRVLAGPAPPGLKRSRHYPFGESAFPVTGMRSVAYGLSGLEEAMDSNLRARAPKGLFRFLRDLARPGRPGDDVVVTLDARVQQEAYEALEGREGAVAAIEVATGEILALASSPSIDPAIPPGIPWVEAERAGRHGPLVNHAIQRRYFPGSTFKVVVDAAWRELHPGEEITVDCRGRHPRTKIRELGRRAHGPGVGLSRGLADSCNVFFSDLALRLGPDLPAVAERFGFNRRPALVPGPGSVAALPSRVLAEESAGELQAFPPEWYPRNIGLTGQAGVGQNLVEATPLQMAAVAAVIAERGLYREPHLVREIRRRQTAPAAGETGDQQASWLDRTRPDIPEPRRALSEEAALAVARDMRLVVTEGTGRRMLDPEFPLAGKTGTAQTGDMDGDGLDEEPHAWFIAFAPVDDPTVAVAVVVEHGGSGGRVAGPVARRVLEAAVAALAEEEEP